jgi:hypothetical protein
MNIYTYTQRERERERERETDAHTNISKKCHAKDRIVRRADEHDPLIEYNITHTHINITHTHKQVKHSLT